jgi:hypothetical protein
MQIPITCDVRERVPLGQLRELQEDLKDISPENLAKLKESILNKGFSFPFFVWVDGVDYWIIDGHQRLKAIREMISEGYLFGDLPIAKIEAQNMTEAKEKLLLATSKYAYITEDGFLKFTKDFNFDNLKNKINLPDVNVEFLINMGGDFERNLEKIELQGQVSNKAFVIYFTFKDKEDFDLVAQFFGASKQKKHSCAFNGELLKEKLAL